LRGNLITYLARVSPVGRAATAPPDTCGQQSDAHEKSERLHRPNLTLAGAVGLRLVRLLRQPIHPTENISPARITRRVESVIVVTVPRFRVRREARLLFGIAEATKVRSPSMTLGRPRQVGQAVVCLEGDPVNWGPRCLVCPG
jgi:hypothetical protein